MQWHSVNKINKPKMLLVFCLYGARLLSGIVRILHSIVDFVIES